MEPTPQDQASGSNPFVGCPREFLNSSSIAASLATLSCEPAGCSGRLTGPRDAARPESQGSGRVSRRSQLEGGADMASAWQRAIATARLFATVASSASASEREASEYVRRVLSYQDRQRIEQ